MKGHPFTTRLGYAMAGLRAAWQSEKSLRPHAVATVFIVILLVLTRAQNPKAMRRCKSPPASAAPRWT